MAAPLFADDPDIVTCIPTSHRRRLLRGFNLGEELAMHCATYLDLTFQPQLLQKTGNSDQRQRSARERRAQPTGLYLNNKSALTDLTGRRILIVDDVMTTGSTLEEAAIVLKQHGAASVGAWCLARTPKI